jgi:acyl carrier protein
VDAEEELSGPVPIGRPIANTQLYILDRKMRVVPVGAKGEIYIGGEGLARGYLNKPAATAEVFVPDPFSGRAGARLYRTGDFGKYRSDGNIEFLGRIDHQVKVRGYRIEPGEIESVLEQHQGIKEAVVLARGEKDKRLVAYLVSSNGERVPVSELREYLRQRLPDYMVASGYVWMEEMPVTANGKLDRAALPEPDDEAVGRETDYVPPTGEVERALAEIWSKVIGVQRVGIYDSFFELGGDSLKLTQVQALIEHELNYELSLAEMFQYPTIQLLAQLISAGEKATFVEEDNRHLDTLMHGKQNLLQQRRQRTEKKSES